MWELNAWLINMSVFPLARYIFQIVLCMKIIIYEWIDK